MVLPAEKGNQTMITTHCTAVLAGLLALTAAFMTPLSAGAAPAGTYLQSCRDISLSDNNLSASCRNEAGSFQLTGLDLSTCVSGSDIGNNNGQLQCNTPRQNCDSYACTNGGKHGGGTGQAKGYGGGGGGQRAPGAEGGDEDRNPD
jgi:hypothetical protein